MEIPTIHELTLLHNHLCQAISDPKRIQILYALAQQPQHVTAIAKELGFPQPTVSRHLRILRQCRLVKTEREGPAVVYSLADKRVIHVLDTMRGILHEHLEAQRELARIITH